MRPSQAPDTQQQPFLHSLQTGSARQNHWAKAPPRQERHEWFTASRAVCCMAALTRNLGSPPAQASAAARWPLYRRRRRRRPTPVSSARISGDTITTCIARNSQDRLRHAVPALDGRAWRSAKRCAQNRFTDGHASRGALDAMQDSRWTGERARRKVVGLVRIVKPPASDQRRAQYRLAGQPLHWWPGHGGRIAPQGFCVDRE